MIHRASFFLTGLLIGPLTAGAETIESDICIYGATSGGVAAAVQAARMGKRVALVEPGTHVGGLSSGGLGQTDTGNKGGIGGVSREFYRRLGKHYGNDENWTFEPRVAETTFRAMLEEAKVVLRTGEWLASVGKRGTRIVEFATESGTVYRAAMFVDATYEGDLMAKAGVGYAVGREANAAYGETLNGIRGETPLHQFTVAVDPYVKAGDPSSGLLPGIAGAPFGAAGAADRAVQAYNFRMCLTDVAENRLPFAKPEGYDPARYELLLRYILAREKAGRPWDDMQRQLRARMPNGKTDTNNNGAFSTDHIGANHDWPEADRAGRERIFRDHLAYQQGLMHFLTHDERVPERIRKEIGEWGSCKDEFVETGGWSHQLYVREARRMVSDYVMTQHDCEGRRAAEDPVGLGSYNMDSHNCRRVVRNGRVENEGDFQVRGPEPYPISYRSIVPKESECANLFVPVCLAATHAAYGSIRMEPVFMVLGQSAATAAGLAIDEGVAVQKVHYAELRERLRKDGQILEWKVESKK